jgi:hypothetical protein
LAAGLILSDILSKGVTTAVLLKDDSMPLLAVGSRDVRSDRIVFGVIYRGGNNAVGLRYIGWLIGERSHKMLRAVGNVNAEG